MIRYGTSYVYQLLESPCSLGVDRMVDELTLKFGLAPTIRLHCMVSCTRFRVGGVSLHDTISLNWTS